MILEKSFHPTDPVRCILTSPSESGKSVFLTILIFNIINYYDKIYIYSSSLHQDLYQKLFKFFSKYKSLHIISNILNGKDIDLLIEEVIMGENFEKL